MQDQIATLGIGFVVGVFVALKVSHAREGSLRRFWKKAFDDELKAHAKTKERHDTTIQEIANVLATVNLEMQINGKRIVPEECSDEWPGIIGEK